MYNDFIFFINIYMEKLVVFGGQKLFGEVELQVSKNAVLPIMSACLLNKDRVELTKLPNITDVENMIKILSSLGVEIEKQNSGLTLDMKHANLNEIDDALVKSMRSSVFLLGSMLGRFKQATFSSPGGCRIGARPIDLHIKAFKKLGVRVCSLEDRLFFDARGAHVGRIKLKIPSVGVTENIIQFACLLKGETEIINPAKEPEVVDLCNFLNSCGANIVGAGTNKITIYGVNSLHSAQYTPMPDRIVEGTILLAVAMCGGEVKIKNACGNINSSLIKKLVSMGCQICLKGDIIIVSSESGLKNLKKVCTGFYPDFATDLQSMFTALCSVSAGKTKIRERVFENRFLIVDELIKMGAKIKRINRHTILVEGVEKLYPASLHAQELRGGAALVLAALMAEGKTEIGGVHFIDRGYEKIETTFSSLGAKIKRE